LLRRASLLGSCLVADRLARDPRRGLALVLGRWVLVGYALVFVLAVWSFVHWYEEPTLRHQFGSPYDDYRATVPGWWPRRRRSRASNRHVS
jgi:protein-S-isoprenylcysteine O-methyltransferase Ste14